MFTPFFGDPEIRHTYSMSSYSVVDECFSFFFFLFSQERLDFLRPFLMGDFFFEVTNRAFFAFKLVNAP